MKRSSLKHHLNFTFNQMIPSDYYEGPLIANCEGQMITKAYYYYL